MIAWDDNKRRANLTKHHIDFADAQVVLFDPVARVIEDTDASGEQRFKALGTDALGRLLVVVYTYHEPDTIRLISARPATPLERKAYER